MSSDILFPINEECFNLRFSYSFPSNRDNLPVSKDSSLTYYSTTELISITPPSWYLNFILWIRRNVISDVSLSVQAIFYYLRSCNFFSLSYPWFYSTNGFHLTVNYSNTTFYCLYYITRPTSTFVVNLFHTKFLNCDNQSILSFFRLLFFSTLIIETVAMRPITTGIESNRRNLTVYIQRWYLVTSNILCDKVSPRMDNVQISQTLTSY